MKTRLLLLAVILGVLASAGTPALAAETKVVTIAVLPFENVTKNAEISWLGHGFAETLATKLSNISTIQLVERTQLSQALKELKLQDTAVVDPKTAGKLGKIVGARYVIVGSYQKAGDALKADARRVEVETAVASGGVDVMGEYAKVFALQSELALKLATALGAEPTEPESRVIAKPPTKSLTAYEWVSKGNEQFYKADFDNALVSYTRAIELDSNYDIAYYNRGNVHAEKGRLDKAIADFSKAIAINPKGVVIYNNRGVVYDRSGQPDLALADFRKALSLNPNYGEAYSNRGIALRRKGDYAGAIASYNSALTINPRDTRALNNRGNVYLDMGEPDRALADFDRAILLNPDSATLYNNRGNAYYHKADYVSALAEYKRAISLNPAYSDPYYWKGWSAIKLGRKDEALTALRRFLDIAPANDPNRENAQKMIGALEAP